MIEYGKPVRSPRNCLPDFDHEFHSERPQRAKNVGLLSAWVNNLPTKEAPFDSGRMFLSSAVVVTPRHRRLVRRNHLVRRPVLPNRAIIDPHHAMAQSPNLVELVGHQD